mmetsp:Transcript_8795/g.19023  ORF Transcript_8795/g.19023 Transcript_8795/m.19023 type:complete len:331 (-) Transcript_8795:134-1126(-)
MGEGGIPTAAAWETITAELERFTSRTGSSLEEFALQRARKMLEQLRCQTSSDATDANAKAVAALRTEVAMEHKRHQVLQERIDEAMRQARAAEETRAALQFELAEVSRKVAQNAPDSPSKRATSERTRDLQAQLAAAKVEARQITDETRAMAVERHEIEQLIAEADFRPFAAGSTTAKGQDQDQLKSELLQIAHRASDNARTLQEAMAEVSSKASPPPASGAVPETSATAAFLNSDLGKGLPQSKLDISKGLFHSSGGLQHLANRGQGLDNSSTASTGSPASAAYPSRSTGDLDSIQERLHALRGHLSEMANQRQHVNGSAMTASDSAAG